MGAVLGVLAHVGPGSNSGRVAVDCGHEKDGCSKECCGCAIGKDGRDKEYHVRTVWTATSRNTVVINTATVTHITQYPAKQ